MQITKKDDNAYTEWNLCDLRQNWEPSNLLRVPPTYKTAHSRFSEALKQVHRLLSFSLLGDHQGIIRVIIPRYELKVLLIIFLVAYAQGHEFLTSKTNNTSSGPEVDNSHAKPS